MNDGFEDILANEEVVAGVSFDCDSTLTTEEGIDRLAELRGVGDEVKAMTHDAMGGKMPFGEALERRLALIRPTREDMDTLARIYKDHAVEGMQELIEELRMEFSVRILIVSGGFRDAILPLADDLEITPEDVLAIRLKFDPEGNYQGIDTDDPITADLMQEEGKRKAKERWSAEHPDVVLELHVGDGATDLDPRKIKGVKVVGFGAIAKRLKVATEADAFCDSVKELRQTLRGLLRLYAKRRERLLHSLQA